LVARGDLGMFWVLFRADLCFKAFRLVSIWGGESFRSVIRAIKI
jgi:hypothetical protein